MTRVSPGYHDRMLAVKRKKTPAEAWTNASPWIIFIKIHIQEEPITRDPKYPHKILDTPTLKCPGPTFVYENLDPKNPDESNAQIEKYQIS